MQEQRKNLYDLLSGFYTLLWAQLDNLFDEHHWARLPSNVSQIARTPEVVLKELDELVEQKKLTLPISLVQMKDEAKNIQDLVGKWRDKQAELKSKPTEELRQQVNDLHREIQDKRALFEERAIDFASRIASSRNTR